MLTTLHLSDWLDWDNRGELPSSSGIYIIAKGSHSNVVYIGRTWGNGGLRKRISAFNRSATTGVAGHAGGVTYNHTFGSDVSDLFVRSHTPKVINPNTDILRPYVEYAERRLIWEHVEQFGQLPKCNSE
jgi:hypothetical protein